MRPTNCPNCGAPIDISRSSCEYCGTPYEKSNDIHIEVTAPDPSIENFAEVLSRISRRSGFNLMDSSTLYADNQPVKYERKKELLHDILGVLILLGQAIITGVITWFFQLIN